jgi:hypothetical protein
MGNRLTHGLGGRSHWLEMLGGVKGGGQRSAAFSSGQLTTTATSNFE